MVNVLDERAAAAATRAGWRFCLAELESSSRVVTAGPHSDTRQACSRSTTP
jgi:hypothetical protein